MTVAMTQTEFLLARIADEESLAHDAASEGTPDRTGWQLWTSKIDTTPGGERLGPRGSVEASPTRVLAECEAKRKIIAFHESWPTLAQTPAKFERVDDGNPNNYTYRMSQKIAWLTTREYMARFGTEPPTSPMIAALAAVYSDHPDYLPEWA